MASPTEAQRIGGNEFLPAERERDRVFDLQLARALTMEQVRQALAKHRRVAPSVPINGLLAEFAVDARSRRSSISGSVAKQEEEYASALNGFRFFRVGDTLRNLGALAWPRLLPAFVFMLFVFMGFEGVSASTIRFTADADIAYLTSLGYTLVASLCGVVVLLSLRRGRVRSAAQAGFDLAVLIAMAAYTLGSGITPPQTGRWQDPLSYIGGAVIAGIIVISVFYVPARFVAGIDYDDVRRRRQARSDEERANREGHVVRSHAQWSEAMLARAILPYAARFTAQLDLSDAIDHAITADELAAACTDGHIETVRRYLRSGADPNAGISDGGAKTPVFLAARHGHLDIVRLLEGYGADLNRRDYFLRSPLNRASKYGHDNVVEYLLAHGATVTNGWHSGHLPGWAHTPHVDHDLPDYVPEGGIGMADGQVYSGYDADTLWGGTPLHLAAAFGELDTVKRLIAAGISPNARDLRGQRPHRWAANRGRGAAALLLLRDGAQPDPDETAPVAYTNDTQDTAVLVDYVTDYAAKLGLTLTCVRQSAFREWLGFWRKLWFWSNYDGVFVGVHRRMELLDWYMLLLGGHRIIERFTGRPGYLNYGESARLTLKIADKRGLLQRSDPLVSGYIYAYLFLVTYHCALLGRRSVEPSLERVFGWKSVQPDGDILIDLFPNRLAPTTDELATLDSSLLEMLTSR